MKKLVIKYQSGTIGKEFFECIGGKIDSSMKYRMEELDDFGTSYTVEDATYEEFIEYSNEKIRKYSESWEKLYEGLTGEERIMAMLTGKFEKEEA